MLHRQESFKYADIKSGEDIIPGILCRGDVELADQACAMPSFPSNSLGRHPMSHQDNRRDIFSTSRHHSVLSRQDSANSQDNVPGAARHVLSRTDSVTSQGDSSLSSDVFVPAPIMETSESPMLHTGPVAV